MATSVKGMMIKGVIRQLPQEEQDFIHYQAEKYREDLEENPSCATAMGLALTEWDEEHENDF